jgi:hypothetical protein
MCACIDCTRIQHCYYRSVQKITAQGAGSVCQHWRHVVCKAYAHARNPQGLKEGESPTQVAVLLCTALHAGSPTHP